MADKSLAPKKSTPASLPEPPDTTFGGPNRARVRMIAVILTVLAALALTAGGVNIGDINIGDINIGVQSPLELPVK